MIAHRFEWRGQPGEHVDLLVQDRRYAAVPRLGGPTHDTAEQVGDGLVTEADTEHRQVALLDDLPA